MASPSELAAARCEDFEPAAPRFPYHRTRAARPRESLEKESRMTACPPGQPPATFHAPPRRPLR